MGVGKREEIGHLAKLGESLQIDGGRGIEDQRYQNIH